MTQAVTKPREDKTANLFFANETERWLAGGIVLYCEDRPDFVRELFEIIPPGRFQDLRVRAMAETAAELMNSGQGTFTAIDLLRAAKASGKLPPQGNVAVLMGDFVESAAMHISPEVTLREAEIYARQLKKLDAADRLALLLPELRNHASRPLDVLAGELRAVLADMEDSGFRAETGLAAQLDDYLTELDENGGLRPVPTPWRELNGILRGGILPGELAILAARPSVGKSTFALNLAYSVASSGPASLFFSLEMSLKQLFDRLMANVGDVDVGAFRKGITKQDRAAVGRATEVVKGKPLVVLDDPRTTLGSIRRRVRAAQKRGPVGLVVVDYLQLVTPEQRNASREREVAEISRGMKLMAKELQVPALLLAQLNRKVEESKREPMLSDLRESGSIEQDADIVMFLHAARQAWHHDEPVRVIVAKGRSSGVGRASLIFKRLVQRFEDSNDQVFTSAQASEAPVKTWHDETGDDQPC